MKFCILLLAGVLAVSVHGGHSEVYGRSERSEKPGTNQNTAHEIGPKPGIPEQINPSTLVTSNCIMNGEPCSPTSGKPCCLSPVFSCQKNPVANGVNQCLLVAGHVQNIPKIKKYMHTYGGIHP